MRPLVFTRTYRTRRAMRNNQGASDKGSFEIFRGLLTSPPLGAIG